MLSMSHLFIILVIVLLIFGAGKLPQVGGQLGRAITEFKAGLKGAGDDEDSKKSGESAATKKDSE